MKKVTLTLVIMISSFFLNAQSMSDLFNKSDVKLTWLGVDYSKMKLIGDFSQLTDTTSGNNSDQLRKRYFQELNNLFVAEPNKYDFKSMFKKESISNDIEMMIKLNQSKVFDDIIAYTPPNYSTDKIKDFVSEYNIRSKDGIGIMLITDALNKNLKEATYHLVILNLKTKEILLQQKIIGNARGFGFRNYWAGSVYHLIKQVNSNYYKKWKKEYK